MTAKAVLISDVHYNLKNLEVSRNCIEMAINTANIMNIPLFILGDLLDEKALIRGEVVKSLLDSFDEAKTEVIVLRGNHDSVNEKSSQHSLEFLRHKCSIIAEPTWIPKYGFFIPYQHDISFFKELVFEPGMLFLHQGLCEAASGEYYNDKTAVPREWLRDYRCISGHYHTRQDIKTGRPRKNGAGLFSYLGNPFTINFSEANDPEKGYHILHSDGLLEFVPTNQRKHVVHSSLESPTIKSNDLLWVKLTGTREELSNIDIKYLKSKWNIQNSLKLDLTYTDSFKEIGQDTPTTILDTIDLLDCSAIQKVRLKALYAEVNKI